MFTAWLTSLWLSRCKPKSQKRLLFPNTRQMTLGSIMKSAGDPQRKASITSYQHYPNYFLSLSSLIHPLFLLIIEFLTPSKCIYSSFVFLRPFFLRLSCWSFIVSDFHSSLPLMTRILFLFYINGSVWKTSLPSDLLPLRWAFMTMSCFTHK